MDTSDHSLNKEKNGQTQGGILADAADGSASNHLSDALMDVCAFESVGVTAFDVSIIGEVQINSMRKFYDFMKHVGIEELRELLPSLVGRCEKERLNLIIRPRIGADRRLVQLDDLDQTMLDRVRELAFRVVETSEGNYQAWVCVIGGDEEMERRLKKFVGADVGANGATRIAGSLNVKEQRKHAGGSYPRVRLVAAGSRVALVEELEMIASIEDVPPCVSSPSVRSASLPMPDYDEFVSRARLSSSGEIDRSAVDYAWAATALSRGHSVEDVMMELSRLSLKAASLSRIARASYVRRTVRAAVCEANIVTIPDSFMSQSISVPQENFTMQNDSSV